VQTTPRRIERIDRIDGRQKVSFEHAAYRLKCPECGMGHAEWSELDGPDGFLWEGKMLDGPGSFFGKRLTCGRC
jgi:hypothetical protein